MLAVDAIRTRDMPLLEGSVLFATFHVVWVSNGR
jgi:ABC-type dipeptide/oligopeptide/nickel transport system permease component